MNTENIPFFEDKKDPRQPDKPTVERNAAHAIVYNKKTDSVLCLTWPEFNWQTFVIGGIEENEDPIVAAKREVEEETGYTHISFVDFVGKTTASFYAAHKGVNRLAHATGMLFVLNDEVQVPVSEEETKNHFYSWIPKDDVGSFINIEPQLYIWKTALEKINNLPL